MISALLVGLALGLRHALEADHVAAVAAVVTGMSSPRAAAVRGAAWGVGHTLTLFVFGGAIILLGLEVSPLAQRILEGAVGVMLLAIGIATMRTFRRLHVHEHQHDDGDTHTHVHAHDAQTDHHHGIPHAQVRHRHRHSVVSSLRAVGIGVVHGLAGSAALVVLAAGSMASRTEGLAFIGLFGVGSVLGMAAMSMVVALPVQLSARYFRRHVPRIVFATGAVSAIVGIDLVVSMSVA